MAKKKGQADVINIIAGLVVISGGIAIILNYVNLGLMLGGLGVLIEAIKIAFTQGLK